MDVLAHIHLSIIPEDSYSDELIVIHTSLLSWNTTGIFSISLMSHAGDEFFMPVM